MPHKILVVEDSPDMRAVVVDTLEDEDDYLVQSASCVQEALKLARKTRFDLLITDVRMPGENGIEGFVELKKLHPGLKCIVITGYSDLPPKELAVLVGVSGYLFKPFVLPEFSNLVDQVINDKKWALFYSNVIKNGPFRALGAIFRALKKDYTQEVNEARNKVFEALFVAISSDRMGALSEKGGESLTQMLPRDTANGLYFQLDQKDAEYERFLSEPTAEAAKQLRLAYEELYERFAAFIRTSAPLLASGRLDRGQFNVLYEGIQSGAVSQRDFLLAPALRSASLSSLRASPELWAMRERVWGAPG